METIIKKTFPVTGMSCAACAVSVETMLRSQTGIKDAAVNFAGQSAWVEYDKELVSPKELQITVQSIGYDLVIEDNAKELQEEAQRKHYVALKKRTTWSLMLSVPLVMIGMFFMNAPYAKWIMMALSAPVVFYFGRNFFINAHKQAKYGKANMDTLVALSTGIAFLFSAFNTVYPEFWHARGMHAHVYFEAVAVVVAFISLGKLLEEKAKSNTSSAIKKLMGLQPKTVRIISAGKEEEIPVARVEVNNIIIIKPGEKIPVDGIVTEGNSFVDESMITGEPIAAEKKKDDKVFAGTINQKGSFLFKAEKVGGNTVLAHIIKMVQEAQASKAPVQKLVDKIAGIFVPVVVAIAILTFVVWMIVGGENAFTHALLAAVTVLVIACPCALGLATPTAIMVGVGKGAENNILIKDAESLELAHKVNAVVLDKTGTITEGKPVVTDVIWNGDVQNDLLNHSIIYALEKQSEHPLAEAVANYFKKEEISTIKLQQFESIIGQGVRAKYCNQTWFVGNKKLTDENQIFVSNHLAAKAAQLQENAKTVVYFSDDKSVHTVIAIADKIKETSAAAIKKLQQSGIEVYMLSGDNQNTAAAIARGVGIANYKAEVFPSQKAAFVKELQQQGKIVAMVGDGINDSHALAQADVSIAMGKGTDIAMDVAKMTLITSDLNAIPKALKLSSKTVKAIRQNLFWAFIYNLIGIPIAAGILYPLNGFLLNPMIAGAAMALSSVSVVSNSLRLKSIKL